MGSAGGTNQGLWGLLRDSDEFVGYDAETPEGQVTAGSAVVTSATTGGFVHRTGWDLVSGTRVPANTIVVSQDSDSQVSLSAPWPGATGSISLSMHHDEHNYCVPFSMTQGS